MMAFNASSSSSPSWVVFIIQNSRNRDTAPMQIKLDELIWGAREA
jgi:low affinity Fe/Cu permease